MKSILTTSLLLLVSFVHAQIKLITPGEHLIYELETFDERNQPVKVSISQGEIWTAIYAKNGNFKTSREMISWDTAHNFTISSDSIKQPMFYVADLPNLVLNGQGNEFNWKDFNSLKPLVWSWNNETYTILYHDDPNCEKLVLKKYGSIIGERELILFKNVNEESLKCIKLNDETKVKLYWTGDLNGDNELDFFLSLPSHHETLIFELIISKITDKGTTWRRVARFKESS
jgi:hypothetical protein